MPIEVLMQMRWMHSDDSQNYSYCTFDKHKNPDLRFSVTSANTGLTACPLALIIKRSSISFTKRTSVQQSYRMLSEKKKTLFKCNSQFILSIEFKGTWVCMHCNIKQNRRDKLYEQ